MKLLTTLITVLFISLLSSPSLSETVSWDNLVNREGLYYKKFSNTPFTGEVSGMVNGKFKNGKEDGYWETYFENGQMEFKGNYKDGEYDGLVTNYHENGNLQFRIFYKNAVYNGIWETYHPNGQMIFKGNLKDGRFHGLSETFDKYGSLERTETYKDGKLVSK